MGVTYTTPNRWGRGGKYLSPWQAFARGHTSEEHDVNPPYNTKIVVDNLALGLKQNWKGVSTGMLQNVAP